MLHPRLLPDRQQCRAEFIIFDMEHGGIGIDMLKAQIAFARGAGGRRSFVFRALLIILLRRCLTRAPWASWRQWSRRGTKLKTSRNGVGIARKGIAHDAYRGGDVVELMREENQRTLVIGLLETAKWISNVDEILSVAGIDVGWLGHYDLTNTMGTTTQFDRPEFNDAVEKLFGPAKGIEKRGRRFAQTMRFKGTRPSFSAAKCTVGKPRQSMNVPKTPPSQRQGSTASIHALLNTRNSASLISPEAIANSRWPPPVTCPAIYT
jgi:hypothetical protein